MKSHIFEDYFLNEIIESQAAGRTTPDHHNGIRSHLESLNKVSQNDFEGETDAFVRMKDT
jgi:hypothetical protein